jgi:hypothetical protein
MLENTKNDSAACIWPRDLLPSRLPGARIMTFGYDVQPWSSTYPIEDILTLQAKTLIEDLTKKRDDNIKMPIVFVASDIGGLILKSALLTSHIAITEQQERRKSIKLSTTGLTLIGVPDPEISDTPTISEIIAALPRNNRTKNTRTSSGEDDSWLKLHLDAFRNISQSFSIVPFYDSSVSRSDSLRLSRLAKFENDNDPDYQIVVKEIERLCDEAPSKSLRQWDLYERERCK